MAKEIEDTSSSNTRRILTSSHKLPKKLRKIPLPNGEDPSNMKVKIELRDYYVSIEEMLESQREMEEIELLYDESLRRIRTFLDEQKKAEDPSAFGGLVARNQENMLSHNDTPTVQQIPWITVSENEYWVFETRKESPLIMKDKDEFGYDGIEERLASRVHSHLRPILDRQTIQSVQVPSQMLKQHGPGNFIHNSALYEFFYKPDKRLIFHSLEELGFGEKDESFDESFTKLYNKVTTCFPLGLLTNDIHRIGKFFCYGRIVDGEYSTATLHLPIPGFLLGDADPNDIVATTRRLDQLNEMVRSLDEEMFAAISVQLKFGQQITHGAHGGEALALLFAVAFERFVRRLKVHHFLQLLEIYTWLDEPRGRNSILQDLRPNRIHPCFHLEKPEEGVKFFMKFAIMKMALRNKQILNNKDLSGKFTTNGKLIYDEFAKPHLDGFNDFSKMYERLKVSSKAAGILSVETAIRPQRKSMKRITGGQERLSLTEYYPGQADFAHVLRHQPLIRQLIVNQPQMSLFVKKEQKAILQQYGDLGTSNPIRPLKSFTGRDVFENTLEAVEVLSEKQDDFVAVQNRLIGFTDMLWLNMHRRESSGNRFTELNLIPDQTDNAPLTDHDVAVQMLFSGQKPMRLREKQGEDYFSRTNRISRNNAYARLLYQFHHLQRSLETSNPRMGLIVRHARPNKKHELRRLLHPIRLQTGKDLFPPGDKKHDKSQLHPYGAIVQIATNRMDLLVEAFIVQHRKHVELSAMIGESKSTVIEYNEAILRSIGCLLAIELCQLHFMAAHLPCNAKESGYFFEQTKLTVNHVSQFESVRDDFSSEKVHWDDEVQSILKHLTRNGLKTPGHLMSRLSKYCFPGNNEKDDFSQTEQEQYSMFLHELNIFCANKSPTGGQYRTLHFEHDLLYEKHAPLFRFDQGELNLD